MLKNQNNRCKLCGSTKKRKDRNLAVDHNHKTGKIRGLLCANCNGYIIGGVEKVKLKNVIKYLSND